jgi:hypothetical protein
VTSKYGDSSGLQQDPSVPIGLRAGLTLNNPPAAIPKTPTTLSSIPREQRLAFEKRRSSLHDAHTFGRYKNDDEDRNNSRA